MHAIFPLLTRRVKIVPCKCQLCNFGPFEIWRWPQYSSKTKYSCLYTPEYIYVWCWQKRSGEIRTTHNPSTKMSMSIYTYEGWCYWSCCSKACPQKDCIDGCVIHEHRDTLTKRSEDIKMTKNLGMKMSASYVINASWVYWPYFKVCLKKDCIDAAWDLRSWGRRGGPWWLFPTWEVPRRPSGKQGPHRSCSKLLCSFESNWSASECPTLSSRCVGTSSITPSADPWAPWHRFT